MSTTLKTQINNYKAKLEGAILEYERLEKQLYAKEREIDILRTVVKNLEDIKEAQEDAQKMVEEAKREVAQDIFCELRQVKCSDCPLTKKERKSDIGSACNYEYSCPLILDGKTYDEFQQKYLKE